METVPTSLPSGGPGLTLADVTAKEKSVTEKLNDQYQEKVKQRLENIFEKANKYIDPNAPTHFQGFGILKDKKAHGTRHNDGKLRWSLVNFKALEPMVRVLMFGADKYGAENWRAGLNVKEISDSLIRHVVELKEADPLDIESTLHHAGHILCNAMFLSYFTIVKPEDAKPD